MWVCLHWTQIWRVATSTFLRVTKITFADCQNALFAKISFGYSRLFSVILGYVSVILCYFRLFSVIFGYSDSGRFRFVSVIFGYSRLFAVIAFPKPAALRDIQAHRTGNVYDACSQGQGHHHNTGLEDAKRGLKHCNRPAMGTHGWR